MFTIHIEEPRPLFAPGNKHRPAAFWAYARYAAELAVHQARSIASIARDGATTTLPTLLIPAAQNDGSGIPWMAMHVPVLVFHADLVDTD